MNWIKISRFRDLSFLLNVHVYINAKTWKLHAEVDMYTYDLSLYLTEIV
jgi:hypothetical protein